MVNKELISKVKEMLRKEAFTPITQEAQNALANGMPQPETPPIDPAMMQGAGAPLPPPPPSMPPIDPAMMQGASVPQPSPPPPAPSMDPAIMQGADSPSVENFSPEIIDAILNDNQTPPNSMLTMSLAELQGLLRAAISAKSSAEGQNEISDRRVTNYELMDKLNAIEAMLQSLLNQPASVNEQSFLKPANNNKPISDLISKLSRI